MDRVLVTLRLEQEGNTLIDCFCAGKLCLFCDALSLAGDAVECSTAVFIGQQSVADKLPCNGNPALRKIQPVGVWIAGKIINGLVERACCSRNAAQQLGSRRRRQSASDSRRARACLGTVTVYAYAAGKVCVEDDDGERGKRACLGVAGKAAECANAVRSCRSAACAVRLRSARAERAAPLAAGLYTGG